MRLFIDTGALAAIGEPRDSRHGIAAGFLRAGMPGLRLYTSNLVFAETMTLLAAHHGQEAAIRFGEGFLSSRIVESIRYADKSLDRAAVAVMRRFRDKDLSFTDAATIVFVRSEGLDGVFGFDEDFRRCGVPLFPN